MTHPEPHEAAEPLLTVRQVSELMGVGKATVYRMIAAGDLRRIDIGYGGKSNVRIALSDYQAFVQSRRRKAS